MNQDQNFILEEARERALEWLRKNRMERKELEFLRLVGNGTHIFIVDKLGDEEFALWVDQFGVVTKRGL